jgi:hypothetical protein
MLYIVFSRNSKCDDEYDNDRMVEYISEDKQKSIDFLNSERERYFSSEVGEIYLDEKYHFIFGNCYNWDYEYWIEKYPLDTDIRRWSLDQKITDEF